MENPGRDVAQAPDPPVGPSAPPPPPGGPPPYPPGWGAPPPRPPSKWRMTRTEPRRRTFWMGCLGIILVPVLLVAVVLVYFGRDLGIVVALTTESGGQISYATVNTVDGKVRWELHAAPGLDLADGPRLACDVVRPIFARHGSPVPEFYVLDRAGDVIASWRTPCGPEQPSGPSA